MGAPEVKMKKGNIRAFLTAAILGLAGITQPVSAVAQGSKGDAHPATGPGVERITVTTAGRITKAAGFAAGDCGAVTTFDAVKNAEDIDVAIAGSHYRGIIRPLGPYSQEFDLACIDLFPRITGQKVVTFPYIVRTGSYNLRFDVFLSLDDPGLPLLNDHGEIVAMFAGSVKQDSKKRTFIFVPAENIISFLLEAEKDSMEENRVSLLNSGEGYVTVKEAPIPPFSRGRDEEFLFVPRGSDHRIAALPDLRITRPQKTQNDRPRLPSGRFSFAMHLFVAPARIHDIIHL